MRKGAGSGDQAARMIKAAHKRLKEEEKAAAPDLAKKIASGFGSIMELL